MEPPPGFLVKRGVRGKPSGDLDRANSSQAPGTPTASMTPSATDDTPFGFGPAPSLTGSVAAFKRRCEWFYVDPNGEEHGPVPYAKLNSWYKKGHFPDDVKVRCRSPWFGIASLMKSMEDAPDTETPTAAAAAHRLGGSFSGPDGLIPPHIPPPPPPPRTGSAALGGGAPLNYEGELKLLFLGDPTWAVEPVWYYIDVRDAVQGPFSGREMTGWVASGMLMEDTRACGADPGAGFPTRTLFQAIGDMLAGQRRGEPHRPFGLDTSRRKTPPLVGSGGSGLLGHPPPPPPPPPPRRNDSATLDTAASFGAPGRSDAPTWRKDILPPSGGSSGAGAAAGNGSAAGGGSGGGKGSGGAQGRPSDSGSTEGAAAAVAAATAAVAADSAAAAASKEGGEQAARGSASGGGSAGSGAGVSGDGGPGDMAARIASYHEVNAAALDDALAPEDDFEYGDDFKRKRQQERQQQQAARQQAQQQQQQQQQMAAQPQAQMAAAGRGGGGGVMGPGGAPGLGRGLVGGMAGPGGAGGPPGMQGVQLQGLNPAQVQALLQQAQQQQQQLAGAGPQMVMGQVGGLQAGSAGMVPASAPIALATAASGQGLNPALINSLINMQLQQQQQQQRPQLQQVPGSSGIMLMSLPMVAQQLQQQQQQQMPLQQQAAAAGGQPQPQQAGMTAGTVSPQLLQLVNSGQLQGPQLQQLLQQMGAQQQQQQAAAAAAQQQQQANAQQVQLAQMQQLVQQQQQQQQQKQAAAQQQALQQQLAQMQLMQQQQQQGAVLSGPSSQGGGLMGPGAPQPQPGRF